MRAPSNAPRETPPWWRRLWAYLAVVLGLSLSVGWDSLFPLQQGLQRADDVVRLQRKRLELRHQNAVLASELQFLATAEGARAELRRRGKLLPGQHQGKIVVTRPPGPPPPSGPERLRRLVSGAEERAAQRLQDWGEAVACYAARGVMDGPQEPGNYAPASVSKPAEASSCAAVRGAAHATVAATGP
jgi:hypothetical protein